MFSKPFCRATAVIVLVFGIGLLVSIAKSEDKKPADQAKIDQAKIMEEYAKAAEPGPEHKRLKEFVGEWDAVTKGWMPDGTDCGSGKGVMTNKMILGDRYLQMNLDATMQAPDGSSMPFKGMGVSAYDKGKKKYTGFWIDEMSTGFMVSEGTLNGNVMTAEGEFTDPLSGKPSKTREISTKIDDNTHRMELHMTSPEGKMYKAMEITYTRKK